MIVYYSGKKGNTHTFVTREKLDAIRITEDEVLEVDRPYILIVPTYADCHGRGAIPKPVLDFLRQPKNKSLIRGVVGSGNRCFIETFALAASIISRELRVPIVHKMELTGYKSDAAIIRNKNKELCCDSSVELSREVA